MSVVPTSIAFDLTVTGLFTTLAVGGCVHLLSLSDYDQRDTERLRHSPCTFLKVTPSHLAVLGQLADELSPTTELLLGGEALFGSMLARWRAAHPAVSVLNVYGPTEATVNCSEHRIEPGVQIAAGPVPLGVAQPGNRRAVLDNDLRPVGQGGTGGLYVGGSGLARGYLRRPSLTAARFLPDPAGPPGARRYWTGDLVRADADDRLTFVGRADDQVKVRGFRVELGEVEAVLGMRPDIAGVAVVVRGSGQTTDLAAFVVTATGTIIDHHELRRFAMDELPPYMVPSTFVVVDELPRQPNGKTDRRALRDQANRRQQRLSLTEAAQRIDNVLGEDS